MGASVTLVGVLERFFREPEFLRMTLPVERAITRGASGAVKKAVESAWVCDADKGPVTV